MKKYEYKFRLRAYHPPEFRPILYETLEEEKSKGEIDFITVIEECGPPPEQIKDILIIVSTSLTIIKTLYDIWKISKKNGKSSVFVEVNDETFELDANNIDKIKVKIEKNKKGNQKLIEDN